MKVDLSVITCTKNSEQYISKCVESVLCGLDKYSGSWQWIIVDGDSSDNTLKLIPKHRGIEIIKRKPNGIYDAMNHGVSNAKGRYISYIHSDDEIDEGFFANSGMLSGRVPESAVCEYGRVCFINNFAETIYERCPPIFSEFLNKRVNTIFHPNAIWTRRYESKNPYLTNIGLASDWDHSKRLNRKMVKPNNQMVYRFRINSCSSTQVSIKKQSGFPFWNLYLLLFETRLPIRLLNRILYNKRSWHDVV
jgi:glycosyltransferase involved in cell wall biosynthesis